MRINFMAADTMSFFVGLSMLSAVVEFTFFRGRSVFYTQSSRSSYVELLNCEIVLKYWYKPNTYGNIRVIYNMYFNILESINTIFYFSIGYSTSNACSWRILALAPRKFVRLSKPFEAGFSQPQVDLRIGVQAVLQHAHRGLPSLRYVNNANIISANMPADHRLQIVHIFQEKVRPNIETSTGQ